MNYLLCAHRLVHGGARHRWRSTPARGQVPPTLRARCPVVPTASHHRLSVSTATVSVSMVAGRILAAWRSWRAGVDEDGHYSFAVPLGRRSPPRAPIGRFATPCDLALRPVGGRPAGIATWSARLRRSIPGSTRWARFKRFDLTEHQIG